MDMKNAERRRLLEHAHPGVGIQLGGATLELDGIGAIRAG
jgi:hypothetical protein